MSYENVTNIDENAVVNDVFDDEDSYAESGRSGSEDSSINTLESTNDDNMLLINFPSCPICLRKYNFDKRTAHVIIDCGHSICCNCLTHIYDCPICRTDITSTVINWAINSEITRKKENIKPFFQIFIDLKEDIEALYLLYPEHNMLTLNKDQLVLINKIKLRFKGLEFGPAINDEMINMLLLPNWLKIELIRCLCVIKEYKTLLKLYDLSQLEKSLPFCL